MFKSLLSVMGLSKEDNPKKVHEVKPVITWVDKMIVAESFDRICAEGKVFVEWKNGNPSCVLTFDEQDVCKENIVIFDEGILKIKANEHAKSAMRVRVSSPSIHAVHFSKESSGNISGIACDIFQANMQSNGKLVLKGKAIAVNLKLEGPGRLEADGFDAHTVEANLNGIGFLEAKAESVARAVVNGGGEIIIYGNPSVKSIQRDGEGRIQIGTKISADEIIDDSGIFGQLPIPRK